MEVRILHEAPSLFRLRITEIEKSFPRGVGAGNKLSGEYLASAGVEPRMRADVLSRLVVPTVARLLFIKTMPKKVTVA